jgi:hypothetical protein
MKTCASSCMSHSFTYCNLIVSIKMKGDITSYIWRWQWCKGSELGPKWRAPKFFVRPTWGSKYVELRKVGTWGPLPTSNTKGGERGMPNFFDIVTIIYCNSIIKYYSILECNSTIIKMKLINLIIVEIF